MAGDHQVLRGQFLDAITQFHSKEENAAAYDAYVKDYAKVLPKYQGHHQAVAGLMRIYPDRKDIRILDIGAGTGFAGKELYTKGYRNLDALEPAKCMLEEARKQNVYTKLFDDFLGPNRLPIEDNTYDAILGAGMIAPGHVKEDCFGELIRITKPGGHVVLCNREKHILNMANIENGMKQQEEAGKWRMLSREVCEEYDENDANGVLHILQVN